MNRRFLIGAIIAAVVIIVGGASYLLYNFYSADSYTRDFCIGVTGTSWKNCTKNMASWKRYMILVDNTRFKQMIENADALRKTSGGSSTTTSTGGEKITLTRANGSVSGLTVKASVYVPCTYTFTPTSGAATTKGIYFPMDISGTSDSSGNFIISDNGIKDKAKTTCLANKVEDAGIVGTADGTLQDQTWYLQVAINDASGASLKTFADLSKESTTIPQATQLSGSGLNISTSGVSVSGSQRTLANEALKYAISYKPGSNTAFGVSL